MKTHGILVFRSGKIATNWLLSLFLFLVKFLDIKFMEINSCRLLK